MSANSSNSGNSGNFRKRQAILCGVSNYSRIMGNPLPTVEQEIPAIADTLSNKLHEGYRYKVTSLLNENVTLDDLPTIFAPYKQDSPTDELLFYFSGHGTIYKGEPYFVTYGAESNNPGIKLSDLATQVSSLHPGIKQIFLILDFCHSGGILQAISVIGSERVSVLTATRQFQVAEVTTQDGKSFAQHFIDGTTNAPANNGEISFGQLAHYIKEQMKTSYVQSPSFFSIGDVAINKINTKFFVPYKRNPFFTGREEILSQIYTHLSNKNNVAITQPPAISGPGGIGKTQTVIEYCYHYRNCYTTILWVKSQNPSDFNSSYFDLAVFLGLIETASPKQLNFDDVVLLIKNWLLTNSHWLMVWDNLEDPELLDKYLPTNYQGHILITTQAQNLGPFSKTIQLDKMSIDTGSLFLLRRCELLLKHDALDKVTLDDLFFAKEITKEMDGLPLALDQAGAYISQTPSSLQEYLDLYKDARHAAKLRNKRGKYTDDHISVTATFQLAFDKVKSKNPIAAKVLEACSFLASDLIPEEIFTQGSNFLSNQLTTLIDDPLDWHEILEILSSYSLLKRDTNNKSLSIHRLVQAVIRDLMDSNNKIYWVESLTKALEFLCRNHALDPKNWSKYQRFLPSTLNLFNFSDAPTSIDLQNITLFHQFGLYCDSQALYPEALKFYQKSLTISKQHLIKKFPSTINILKNITPNGNLESNPSEALEFYQKSLTISKHSLTNNFPSIAGTLHSVADILNSIASVYKNQGNYSQALNFYQQSLFVYEQNLQDNLPSIADIFNNIGEVYRNLNNYSQALKFYSQALNIKKQLFGDNHISIGNIINNIAIIYESKGKYSQALDLYNQALNIYEQYPNNNLLFVAPIFNNIGKIYYNEHNYSQALKFYSQALNIKKQLFGDNHPEVANSLNNIATVYQLQDKHPQALDLYDQALHIYRQRFSDNHPFSANVLSNIALSFYYQGKYSKALELYDQVLNTYKQYFGDNSPHIADTLNKIANIYKDQDKHSQALDLYDQTLSIYRQHPENNILSIVGILNNIGEVYRNQAKYSDALDFYQQSLNLANQFLDDKLQVVADTISNIASVYYFQEDYSQALDYYLKALHIKKLHFSHDLFYLANTLNNVAIIYDSQGKYSDAFDFYSQALKLYKEHFGNNHPLVALILENLGNLCESFSKDEEATIHYQQALDIYDHLSSPNYSCIVKLLDIYSKLLFKLNRNDQAQALLDRLIALDLLKNQTIL